MHKKITKVIIPVAGSGTRFLPATKAQPKEMLPVIDKPVIQYLVEEVVRAGITDVILITGRNKRAIEDHFDAAPELEATLEASGKTKALEQVRAISNLARFTFVRQAAPLGDGDAILCAGNLIGKDEAVGVMFGDDIFSGEPRLSQIGAVYEQTGEVVAALERVPRAEVSRYGVVGGRETENGLYEIDHVVEKPKTEDAPSDLILMGTYILTRDIFDELKALRAKGATGELRIADALKAHAAKKKPIYGVTVKGERHDCGEKLGYLKTIVDFGVSHPEFGDAFKEYVKKTAESL